MSLESEVQKLTEASNSQTAASQALAQEVAGKMAEIDDKVSQALQASIKSFSGSVSKTIGPGGDYETLSEAIEYYSSNSPLTTKSNNRTYTAGVILRIKSGTVIGEQVLVGPGADLSFLRIDSEDAVVYVDHTKLTNAYDGRYPLFAASRGGKLPVINTLFMFNSGGTGNKDGIMVNGPGSSVYVYANKGVKGAPGCGLYASNCAVAHAAGSDFSGSLQIGVYGVYGALINFNSGVATDCADDGIYAYRGSIIIADRCNVDNSGRNGISAADGSNIFAYGASANGAGAIGCNARESSFVNFTSGKANNAGQKGIYAYGSCIIQAHSAFAEDAGEIGVEAYASKINAIGVMAPRAATTGLKAQMTSVVCAHSSNFQKGDTPDSSDVAITYGSQLVATGSFSGGLSFAANTVTANGIIYQ